MMTKEHNYYYNPYLPEDREGKGEMMSFIRAMLLLCITILLSVGTFIFTNYTKDRFEIVPLKDGVFIFDRQTTASNFCSNNKCIVLSSEFLIPKKVLVAEIPGVITKTQIQVQNPAAQSPTPAPAPVVQNNPVAAQPVQPQMNPGLNQQMAQNQNDENNPGVPDQSQQDEMNDDGNQTEQQGDDQQNFNQQSFDDGQNDNQGNDQPQN
jgi:hypothetical protein